MWGVAVTAYDFPEASQGLALLVQALHGYEECVSIVQVARNCMKLTYAGRASGLKVFA
jgi:hypothetical protein